jgi:hypothetical protein
VVAHHPSADGRAVGSAISKRMRAQRPVVGSSVGASVAEALLDALHLLLLRGVP